MFIDKLQRSESQETDSNLWIEKRLEKTELRDHDINERLRFCRKSSSYNAGVKTTLRIVSSPRWRENLQSWRLGSGQVLTWPFALPGPTCRRSHWWRICSLSTSGQNTARTSSSTRYRWSSKLKINVSSLILFVRPLHLQIWRCPRISLMGPQRKESYPGTRQILLFCHEVSFEDKLGLSVITKYKYSISKHTHVCLPTRTL